MIPDHGPFHCTATYYGFRGFQVVSKDQGRAAVTRQYYGTREINAPTFYERKGEHWVIITEEEFFRNQLPSFTNPIFI